MKQLNIYISEKLVINNDVSDTSILNEFAKSDKCILLTLFNAFSGTTVNNKPVNFYLCAEVIQINDILFDKKKKEHSIEFKYITDTCHVSTSRLQNRVLEDRFKKLDAFVFITNDMFLEMLLTPEESIKFLKQLKPDETFRLDDFAPGLPDESLKNFKDIKNMDLYILEYNAEYTKVQMISNDTINIYRKKIK